MMFTQSVRVKVLLCRDIKNFTNFTAYLLWPRHELLHGFDLMFTGMSIINELINETFGTTESVFIKKTDGGREI